MPWREYGAGVTQTVVFAPPSHGMWELETTHHGLRPLSPFLRQAYMRAFEAGTTVLVERWGLPATTTPPTHPLPIQRW